MQPRRWLMGVAAALVLLVVGGGLVRVWFLAPDTPLEPWHTEVPAELTADAIDAADWPGYVAAENRLFADVAAQTVLKPGQSGATSYNRYVSGSPVDPARFSRNWNRSYLLEAPGAPRGIVVLLHGLSDSPYSLRHVALDYQRRGWTAIGIRLPGHGTVPAALTATRWQDWSAATRLALREAQRRSGGGALPIEIVGYSNGGALAVQYALAAAGDPRLPQPRRLVLISPMIALTQFARFAGLAGWPATFPAFAKAAWLDLVPEYNPFKYNSFPINAARESYRLTVALKADIEGATRSGAINRLPPIMSFQSLADSTVNTPAIVAGLYDHLPGNGSELVLFDINRVASIAPMLRSSVAGQLDAMLPPLGRLYRVTVITNASPATSAAIERSIDAGATQATTRAIGLAFPPQVYSLSHIALPFPASDGLYGAAPDPLDDFGLRLGTLAARGERGVLSIDLDTLLRLTSNPFFPYMIERIGAAPPASRIGVRDKGP